MTGLLQVTVLEARKTGEWRNVSGLVYEFAGADRRCWMLRGKNGKGSCGLAVAAHGWHGSMDHHFVVAHMTQGAT